MAGLNLIARREAFIRVVRVCMARKGYNTFGELAAHIPMAGNCLSNRVNWHTAWTLEDLWRLVRALDPTPEELAEMMGSANEP